MGRRIKIALVTGGLAVAAIVAVVLVVVLPGGSSSKPGGSPTHKPTTSSGSQVVLPFTGLGPTDGVAVDSVGNVYVTDVHHDNGRVLKLPAR
jgi:hypothetical protein